MTEPSQPKTVSIMDGVKYLYAEALKGRRVTLTIKAATGGVKFVDTTGRENTGFDLSFEETPKILGVVAVTVRRQLSAALGDDVSKYPGRKIVLYSVPSKKSVTGLAIRIAAAEGETA